MSVRHDHEHECTERKTSRLQPTHTRVGALPQSHPGLCGTLVGPGKDSKEEGFGWPDTSSTRRPTTNDNSTDKVSRQTCFQQPGGDTLGNLHGSGAARRTHGDRAVRQLIIEVETSLIIKKIAQNQSPRRRSTRRPSTSRFQQNQYTDKVVDVTVEVQRQFHQVQTRHRKSWRRKPEKLVWVGLPIQ